MPRQPTPLRQTVAPALLISLLACGGGEPSAPPAASAAGLAGGAAAAAQAPGEDATPRVGPLGDGVVVWESNRDGAWRIWSLDLAPASAPRRLTPDEPGRVHCCPHLSPDGTRLAYLSLPPGGEAYREDSSTGPLHVLELATGADTVAAPSARTYYENRAVVWRGNDELIHIDGAGRTVLLDLPTGASRRLTERAAATHGWLIGPDLAFATGGRPSFSPYDGRTRTIAERAVLGGCQPYFSSDGRWGYWVAGAGGPINRIDLASRRVATILRKSDPRSVDGFGYAYFPMFSADRRAFVFAASAGEHDHVAADYEIFAAAADPDSLELVGGLRRITRHPATDRFPDIHLAPLALGRHDGEAPFELDLEPPGDAGDWRWSFGDGATGRGPLGRHLYTRPGFFRVEARRDDELHRGVVRVRPARGPVVEQVEAVDGGHELRVIFDEEVDVEGAVIDFASGRAADSASLSADRRALVLTFAQPIDRFERLALSGISDRAQRANAMAPVTLEVEPPLWPARRDGAIFLWRTGDAPNLFFDRAAGVERGSVLTPSGRAFLDRDHRMVLRGGVFAVGDEDSNRLRWALQASNEMTLELTVEPAASQPSPEGALVVFGRRGQPYNFALLWRRGELVYSQRVAPRNPGMYSSASLGVLPPGRHHLALSYSPGRLALDVDGERVVTSDSVQGDFFHWRSLALTFGGEAGGGREWHGAIEGVALYDRALDAAETREGFERYRRVLERRAALPELVVEARLTGRTPTPALDEIRPYREALAVHEYAVERVVAGSLPAPDGPLRVAHWELLDGARQPAADRRVGDRVTLWLEPFADQPQLAAVFLANRFDAPPRFFDVGAD